MAIIILDGPEKAGKTTLAGLLREVDPTAGYRHWGPVSRHEEYIPTLLDDAPRSDQLIIWDRGWPSEVVYGKLMQRDRELAGDAWLAEWLYGRSCAANGLRVMVLGPSVAVLESRRDDTDLPIAPDLERFEFHQYAQRFDYYVVETFDRDTAADIMTAARLNMQAAQGRHVPVWVGPWNAPVVFVGEFRNPNAQYSWLPFSSSYTMKYGQVIGDDAARVAWTNCDECNPQWLLGRQVIACGVTATEWCYHSMVKCVSVPHPSWVFRWGKAKAEQESVINDIRTVVREAMDHADRHP